MSLSYGSEIRRRPDTKNLRRIEHLRPMNQIKIQSYRRMTLSRWLIKTRKTVAGMTTITTPASKLHMKFAKEGVINPNTLCEYPISLTLILRESGDEGKLFSEIVFTIVTKVDSPVADTIEG
jgi:hypothetical protein